MQSQKEIQGSPGSRQQACYDENSATQASEIQQPNHGLAQISALTQINSLEIR